MSPLVGAVGLSAAGSLGGLLAASLLLLLPAATRSRLVPPLVSYAVGALLGVALVAMLPEAIAMAPAPRVFGTLLGGILLFFVLEKLLLWRHCHTEHCEVHDPHQHAASHPGHDHGRSGALIIVGDTVHNFVDGVLIAAAFLQSTELGIVAAIAIVAHEIPQEVGDFLILLHSGYSRARALAINLLSSAATMVGGVLGYFGLQIVSGWETTLLGIVAASMIYVAVADLIPGLHRRPELRDTASQALLIALGIGTIALVGSLLTH